MRKKMMMLALFVMGLPIVEDGMASASAGPYGRHFRGCSCRCASEAPWQERQRPPQGPPSFINEDLIKGLSLTDEQVAQIKEMEDAFQKKMEEKRNSEENSKKGKNKDRKAEMDAMREEQEAGLKSILTEDQYKLFQEYMENNRPEGGPGGPGGPGEPGGSGGPDDDFGPAF